MTTVDVGAGSSEIKPSHAAASGGPAVGAPNGSNGEHAVVTERIFGRAGIPVDLDELAPAPHRELTDSGFDTIEFAVVRDRRGPGRRRGRRRGPGERGRPDLRRRAGDPRAGRVHRPVLLRGDLRADDRPGLRAARTAADVPRQPGPQGHRLHRLRRREGRRHDGHLGRRTGHDHPAAGRSGHPSDRADPARPRRSRCAPARAGCWPGPGTPRRRSTWPGSPGCGRSACCARWSTTTGRWPGCPSCGLRPAARPGVDLHRRSDRLPPARARCRSAASPMPGCRCRRASSEPSGT